MNRFRMHRAVVTALGVLAVLLVVFTVVDAQPAAQIAMFGALVAASLIALDATVDVIVIVPHSVSAVGADGRRLRGSYRRQEHPATPGRPMPRAPGSAWRPDRWLVSC
ncbi:putative membrane protein [Rhodococcus sp. AW25M09]|uniref:DUF6412 domain-containing protein n=1 Tax=Rhodococcus sp. AW25M09 TaxID=1268303 RepID=UPI0002AC3F71|nr:DUF6412 domain-containing protein [Rhodococcus sp. AW25M09]CCQ17205.1 putative membrane protein [Rhodococcus sp. AW25M09]